MHIRKWKLYRICRQKLKTSRTKNKTKESTTLISIKTGINGKWDNPEAKEEHIKQITLEGEETTVLIKAQDQMIQQEQKNTL